MDASFSAEKPYGGEQEEEGNKLVGADPPHAAQAAPKADDQRSWWKRPPRPAPAKADGKGGKKGKAGGAVTLSDPKRGGGTHQQRTLLEFDKTRRPRPVQAPSAAHGGVDLAVHGYWRKRDGTLFYRFPNGETRVASGTDEWSAADLQRGF